MTNATVPGPALHFSVPSFSPLVALGNWNTGPTPMIGLSHFEGDRKVWSWMSPRPQVSPPSAA
jgi:hypothetical protein